jgi:hypothetical protein
MRATTTTRSWRTCSRWGSATGSCHIISLGPVKTGMQTLVAEGAHEPEVFGSSHCRSTGRLKLILYNTNMRPWQICRLCTQPQHTAYTCWPHQLCLFCCCRRSIASGSAPARRPSSRRSSTTRTAMSRWAKHSAGSILRVIRRHHRQLPGCLGSRSPPLEPVHG